MKPNSILIAGLALANSLSAFAAGTPALTTFTYKTRVPAISESCEVAAQALAQRVKEAAPNAKNVQGQCMSRASFKDNGETFSEDTLKVTYDAEMSILFNTVQLPNLEYNELHVYPKYRDCLTDLDRQIPLFTQATGLKVISASCVPGSDAIYGFSLRIQGVGKALRSMRTLRNLSFEKFKQNAEWLKQAKDFIQSAGGIVAKSDGELIAYYATSDINIGSTSWLQTETLEQCQSQTAEITSMLQKMGVKKSVAVCHADGQATTHHVPRYFLDTFYDKWLDMYLPSSYDNETYYTFDQCMSVRQSVLSSEPAAKSWMGSFCTLVDYISDRYSFKTVSKF
jgi:hypothetical protein